MVGDGEAAVDLEVTLGGDDEVGGAEERTAEEEEIGERVVAGHLIARSLSAAICPNPSPSRGGAVYQA